MSFIETTGESVSPNIPAGFQKRKDGDIMDANRQWATRPPEEAVYSADELVERTRAVRDRSRQNKHPVEWSSLSVTNPQGEALALVGKGGVPAYLTNWSMNQLAGIVGAPANYLTKLPARLAADCLAHGLSKGVERQSNANMLIGMRDDGAFNLRALTTARYERVWDLELAVRIQELCDRGTWGPAEAFRTAEVARVEHAWGEVKKLPLGWLGDRSLFTLLVDYEGAVKTRAGQKLARFVMLQNSEVGHSALKATIGLLDFVCGNMILWSCSEVYEATFKHSKNVRDKFAPLMAPLSKRLGSGESATIVDKISAASVKLIAEDQDKVVAIVANKTKIPKGVVDAAYVRAASTPRYGDPRSVWGMVQGLTEESQHQNDGFMDERVDIDRAAAKLLEAF